MINHFENLYRIREDLDDYRNNYDNIIKSVKRYILNYNNADVSKLDQLLKMEKERRKLRNMLCLEKVIVMGVMDSMVR